jgi:6-phosphogluconolactonase
MLYLPLMFALTQAASEATLFIGTYTSENGSKGIYSATLNLDTGVLSEPMLAAEAPSPSYLAIHPGKRFLYAVHEASGGEVSAYEIIGRGLRRLNLENAGTGGPCHLSVDPTGRLLLVAGYGGGNVAALPIRDDGTLAPVASSFQNTGSGPNAQRQEKPHMHFVKASSDGRFAYACDLGTDDVLAFDLNVSDGTLLVNRTASAKAPAGAGPRHLVFHPTGEMVYVNNEMDLSVSAFAVNRQTGALTLVQTLSSLPAGESKDNRSSAAITLHPSGKWLFVSNRGHDSIAVFEIGADRRLTLSQITSAGVTTPRGIAAEPSGRWLVVAGQNSGDLRALPFDPARGELGAAGPAVRVSRPVCVKFLP